MTTRHCGRSGRGKLVDQITKTERGYADVPLTPGVPASVIGVHPLGADLENADDML